MTGSKSMKTIQALAESAENAKSKVLADGRAQLQTEEQRLSQLILYRADYQKMKTEDASEFTIHSIRGRRGFVQRLNEAIDNQRELVERASQQLDSHLVHWRRARSESLSIKKYSERMADFQAQRQSRKEQAELDDMGRRGGGKR